MTMMGKCNPSDNHKRKYYTSNIIAIKLSFGPNIITRIPLSTKALCSVFNLTCVLVLFGNIYSYLQMIFDNLAAKREHGLE